jgi:hypothetical protein
MSAEHGALVHYVLPDGPETVHGQCRPALVVRAWRDGAANLVVFRDGTNDGHYGLYQWCTSIHESAAHEFGTYHQAWACTAGPASGS